MKTNFHNKSLALSFVFIEVQRDRKWPIPRINSDVTARYKIPHCSAEGSLSNDDGNGNKNVTRKYIFISFVQLRDYFHSLNFYKNGELSGNQIGRSGVQIKKENEKFTVCVHVLHKTLNVVISRCCFIENGKEMYQNVKRTCRAIVFAH